MSLFLLFQKDFIRQFRAHQLGFFSQDGEPRDDFRANYCRQRYDEGCELARKMPVVVTAALDGAQVFPQAVGELDAFRPMWTCEVGPPDAVATCGQNMIAVAPPTDTGSHTFTADVVRNAVVPVADGDFLQIGRENFDDIMNEAFHLAQFKSGGKEFSDSIPSHQAFVKSAATYNDRLKAMSIFLNAMASQSDEEKKTDEQSKDDKLCLP